MRSFSFVADWEGKQAEKGQTDPVRLAFSIQLLKIRTG